MTLIHPEIILNCSIANRSYHVTQSTVPDGHGTHVAGSVAGNSMGNFGDMDGMAPDAKISFFDIGSVETHESCTTVGHYRELISHSLDNRCDWSRLSEDTRTRQNLR